MRLKRILGIILLIVGIAMFFLSNYITEQVTAGKHKIASSQKQVDQGKGLFSLSPYTKDIGKEIAGSGQKKIDEGKQKVAEYEQTAHWLRIGGIVLAILGILFLIFSFVGRSKKQ